MSTVNCQHYRDGKCTHFAAPRKLFGYPMCLFDWPPMDLRLGPCIAQYPHHTQDLKPQPPPSTVRKEGSRRVYTITPIG